MENMDKGLTVPKWVIIVWPKVTQMPQIFSAQFVCPSPKIWDFERSRSVSKSKVKTIWFPSGFSAHCHMTETVPPKSQNHFAMYFDWLKA